MSNPELSPELKNELREAGANILGELVQETFAASVERMGLLASPEPHPFKPGISVQEQGFLERENNLFTYNVDITHTGDSNFIVSVRGEKRDPRQRDFNIIYTDEGHRMSGWQEDSELELNEVFEIILSARHRTQAQVKKLRETKQ